MKKEEAIRHLEAARLMLLGKDNQPISDLYYALIEAIEALEAEPTLYGYDIKFLSSIAAVMAKNGIGTVEAVKIFSDFKRTVDFVLEEQQKEIDKFLKVHFLKGAENGTDK